MATKKVVSKKAPAKKAPAKKAPAKKAPEKKATEKKAPEKAKPSSATTNRVPPRVSPRKPPAVPVAPAEEAPEPIDTAKAVEFAKSIAQAMKRSSAQSANAADRDGTAIRLSRRPEERRPVVFRPAYRREDFFQILEVLHKRLLLVALLAGRRLLLAPEQAPDESFHAH